MASSACLELCTLYCSIMTANEQWSAPIMRRSIHAPACCVKQSKIVAVPGIRTGAHLAGVGGAQQAYDDSQREMQSFDTRYVLL